MIGSLSHYPRGEDCYQAHLTVTLKKYEVPQMCVKSAQVVEPSKVLSLHLGGSCTCICLMHAARRSAAVGMNAIYSE